MTSERSFRAAPVLPSLASLPAARPARAAPLRALGALALCLALLGWSTPASAHHTEEEHVTDDTAWTLAGDKMWRVGLFKVAVGLGDRVTLGTYTLPWAALATNGYLKWRFYGGDVFNWAVQATYFRLDLANFSDAKKPPRFGVGSLALLSSLRLGSALQLSNSLVFTAVRARGTIDADTLAGAGQGGLTNLQYVAALEWRWSRTTALVITGRYLMAQVIDARTSFTTQPDEYTTVEVHADADDKSLLNFRRAFSILPAFVWSWDTFNLELGLGYGNPNVPAVNFTFPGRYFIPTLDLYWTF
jgi:hypothetical protein